MNDIDARRLADEFMSARRDASLAVLEGFHPLKHALRFGAAVERVLTADKRLLEQLCATLAPDVADQMLQLATEVVPDLFDRLAPTPPQTRVIALARRKVVTADTLLQADRSAPLVLLERPSHLGNIGAVIRVAAGAGAAGVVTSGIHDPWGPDAIRGAAGLQYAVPVTRMSSVEKWRGPLLAIDPGGEPLTPNTLPDDAVVAFGSERAGLSDELLSRAAGRVALPMQPGVSSLNLATSVAIVLYCWRLTR